MKKKQLADELKQKLQASLLAQFLEKMPALAPLLVVLRTSVYASLALSLPLASAACGDDSTAAGPAAARPPGRVSHTPLHLRIPQTQVRHANTFVDADNPCLRQSPQIRVR